MIRDLFIREIEKHGATADLADRLLIHGRKPFITWLACRICTPSEDIPVSSLIAWFAEATGLSVHVVRHSYYRASVTSIDARRLESYKAIHNVLVERFPYPALWDELLQYAFAPTRRFAVEVLLEQNVPSADIEDRLNLSKSTVYAIRRDYIARLIQHKGDYPDDTQHN